VRRANNAHACCSRARLLLLLCCSGGRGSQADVQRERQLRQLWTALPASADGAGMRHFFTSNAPRSISSHQAKSTQQIAAGC
jgi:hypothetical protein